MDASSWGFRIAGQKWIADNSKRRVKSGGQSGDPDFLKTKDGLLRPSWTLLATLLVTQILLFPYSLPTQMA